MRNTFYVLLPLAILLVLAVLASFLAYGTLQVAGDFLPLARLISKTTLILLLLSIFPLKALLRLSWLDMGLAPRQQFFRQIGWGLLLGIVTLLPVLITLVSLDVHVWDAKRHWGLSKLLEKTALALLFALLIAIGEELIFRGILLASLRRRLPLLLASGISAIYYAALHFLKSQSQIDYADLTPFSGLQLVGEAFANWLNPDILTAMLALFVVGLFLAFLRSQFANSLGLCIGCHAGWVWEIKLSKDLYNVNPHTEYLYLVSNYDGVVGPLVSIWLLAAIGLWYLWTRYRPARQMTQCR